jgi:hypothetical protein
LSAAVSGRIEEEEKLSRAVTDDESEKENHLGDTLAWADELLSLTTQINNTQVGIYRYSYYKLG